jgi:catechol 2,3-dioxygenase
MAYGVRAPHYRLPETTRPGGLRLQVSDLSRSLEYYEQVLGLRILERDRSEAALGPADATQPLLFLQARTGGRLPRRGERLGLYHFALLVPSRGVLVPSRGVLGTFVAHLAAVGVPLSSADHAVSEALYLWDPDGLGIEVYADRPRTEWRTNGDELFMTTERLDLRSLVDAAGGAEWDGLPAGTVLGHLHLHVGDLAGADAFYHRALGFDKTVWNFPGALFLSAGGYHHHLGTNTWAGNVPPRGDDEPGLVEWDLVVPTRADAEAAAASCAQAGFTVDAGQRDWHLVDPWGTRLRLISDE